MSPSRRITFDIEPASLTFIINHLFLPPKLPQRAESEVGDHNTALLDLCVHVAEAYLEQIESWIGPSVDESWELQDMWGPVVKMLKNFQSLENHNSLDAEAFKKKVRGMKPDDVLALHIGAQNAGLILHQQARNMIFQSFEASPLTTEVLKSVGKLRCSFPGPAISVSLDKVRSDAFLSELASFMEKIKRDTTLAPNTHSRGSSTVSEERESPHPKFVTELLTGILRGIGQPANVQRFEKRLGDEVLWEHAKIPWRRSPLWLTVRVALQTTVMIQGGHESEYKLYMIYLLSHVLELAMQSYKMANDIHFKLGVNGKPSHKIADDILFVMNAKLSRRVSKVMDNAQKNPGSGIYVDDSHPILEHSRRVGEMCARTLATSWEETQRTYCRSLSWAPGTLKYGPDTRLSINVLEEYLRLARTWGSTIRTSRKLFKPQEAHRISQDPEVAPSSPSDAFVKPIALADLEMWVRDHLFSWVGYVRGWRPEDACEELGSLIHSYITTAKAEYSGNPERLSIFFLTLMEMWVGLDILARRSYPLLGDYPPYYFTDGFLNPLLLPEPGQRERLQQVEVYLKQRKAEAKNFELVDNVFSDVPTENSFSVRYFAQRAEYKILQDGIISLAQRRREQKRIELRQKMATQEALKEMAHQMICETFTHREQGWTRHHKRCQKCLLIKEADNMRVEVFEWPLPDDDIKSKAVVFELECPSGFSSWRDATHCIIREITMGFQPTSSKESQGPLETLDGFLELKEYYQDTRERWDQQLHWASSTKSFLNSHYRHARLPTDINSVCVRNSLTFSLYDRYGEIWINKEFPESNIRNECTYKLPDGPYRHLEFALRYTPFTPNQVIARQSDCPPEIQLNEFLAFGLVRSGRRIQWLNMLRELRTRALTLNNEAVNMLFSLCAWQSGPPGDNGGTHREAHTYLQEEEFRCRLLEELRSLLGSIRSNWQEAVTAKTLIVLACQLLMFGNTNSSCRNAVLFLREARAVCLGWVRELGKSLHQCENIQEIRGLQLRIVQIAVICRETYNVEATTFLEYLCGNEEDLAVFVECATLVHDNLSSVPEKLKRSMKVLLERDKRLAHAMEDHLRTMIVDRRVVLDLSQVWGAYDGRSCEWEELESPNQRWITANVLTKSGTYQIAHYNLLTGRLLVDGLPLGRLPAEYLSHPVYQEILGEKLLDVYPASMPGMIFQTGKVKICGNEVAFALHGNSNDLIVRARIGQETYHLLPKAKLKGDFPAHIIDGYVFWLNLRGGGIELRPRDKPWDQTSYPHITSPYEDPQGFRYLWLTPKERLIDVRSDAATMIHAVLSPLEYKAHIGIVVATEEKKNVGQQLLAKLPRLKLDFVVKENKLQCRQFPGIVVDRNQDIGTFIGLDSKLVVRQGSVRSVMVPHGEVTFTPDDSHHVSVDIGTNPKGFARVRYHLYTIDHTLGRLVGNGSLASHLYKIYLHAVTSSCMPDPLTGRTGTEEALALLRSAATWSFQRLEKDGIEAETLRLIAGLSPKRVYYPPHLKSMQQITWNKLSPLSQHESFSLIVHNVFNHAEFLHIFTDGQDEQTYYKLASELHLAKRAAFRNTNFRRDEFQHQAEQLPSIAFADCIYTSRALQLETSNEATVHYIARLVATWPTRLDVCPDLLQTFLEWGDLDDQPLELGYDERLLDLRLGDVWFYLQDTLISCSRQTDTYSIMFTLGTLAFASSRPGGVPLNIIETLLAFATVPEIRNQGLPSYTTYDLWQGLEPDENELNELIRDCAVDFELSEEARLSPDPSENVTELALRRSRTYQENIQDEVTKMVDFLVAQWPCRSVVMPLQWDYSLIPVDTVAEVVRPRFSVWYRNRALEVYTDTLQSYLDGVNLTQTQVPLQYYSLIPYNSPREILHDPDPLPMHEALLSREPPSLEWLSVPKYIHNTSLKAGPAASMNINRSGSLRVQTKSKSNDASGKTIDSLRRLLGNFSHRPANNDANQFPQTYANDLEKSFNALTEQYTQPTSTEGPLSTERVVQNLKQYRDACEMYLHQVTERIRGALNPSLEESGWMKYKAGLWPQLTPVTLVQRLAVSSFKELSNGWKNVLVQYGIAITSLQRAERLLRHAEGLPRHTGSMLDGRGTTADFTRELENTGHKDWNPIDYPDWLLMEAENNVLIRSVQTEVAKTMIAPPKNKNTIMQLLMGEGKTSIIVPIVATALGDGSKLVRVVVLKPLCGQMFQTLVQRLGGLVNRRIFYMPFSRKINVSAIQVKKVHAVLDRCRSMGGILVVQPEHVLSFKLLGLDRLYNAEHRDPQVHTIIQETKDRSLVARLLIEMQLWLSKHSRDILDESDEILSNRHELIYTIGNSKPIEHHPHRWLVVQEVLTLVGEAIHDCETNPESFEIEISKHAVFGGFDSIRILDIAAGKAFFEGITRRILESRLPMISFRHWDDRRRTMALRFITKQKLKPAEYSAMQTGDPDLDNTLLLLRGLIAQNMLLFVLHEKRWKVDYGLDLKRSMLAVPYRAKDSPSAQSEFSHPDVALTLTCLSYYYGGLTDGQLETTFRTLLKTDNPTLEYEKWWKGMKCTGNDNLRHLNAVNLEDMRQWTDRLLPMFRFNKAVIDFYLAKVVFPLEAKEFEHKLSSSGWDIAEDKHNPTTGFSGTNDNKYLLPLSITQHDTPQQLNTNANVLSCLLQLGNRYISINTRLGTHGFLNILSDVHAQGEIRVLLDVGAQVLELNNEDFASTWLHSVPHDYARAAVYFNEDDELTVLTRENVKEPVMISAFADRLDQCLVYLDEAHTRGTDLKLPSNCRAAVTLGPNLTKDRLVQACMRMRKLGSGHSVIFCGPPEIHRELQKLAREHNHKEIEVSDVIHWSMLQTCYNTRKLVPIWAKQGISYRQRHLARKAIESGFPEGLLEQEAKTLDEHYGFERAHRSLLASGPKELETDPIVTQILEKCSTFGVKSSAGAPMLEEQERELCHEIECERELERPPPAEAMKHQITPQLRQLIETGKIPATPSRWSAFVPAFETLCNTTAAEHFERTAWPQELLVTVDFASTVEKRGKKGTDDYLMPVNWVLSIRADPSVLVILSPWEVNRLLSKIRTSDAVRLHMYAPRTTKASPSYNSLDFFVLPPISARYPLLISPQHATVDYLSLFSGQLYFHDYTSYLRICGYLGLYFGDSLAGNSISPDGHVKAAEARRALGMPESPFTRSPLQLLRILIGLRRKGQSYLATHVGCMLHGRPLRWEDIEVVPASELS